jgi:IMP dehydrogenase
VIDLAKFCKDIKIPVIVGNTVTYSATLELMETGCAAVLVGVGPGAACTSRGVLGIAAAARFPCVWISHGVSPASMGH